MSEKKGFVHIIESPSSEDLLDGQTEGKSICTSFELSGIPHCYNLVTDENTFHMALSTRLINAWEKYEPTFPYLHLSMHGNDDGIELTNNTFYTWDQLHNLLSPLIKVMNGNLIITMSTCEGAAGIKMALKNIHGPTFQAIIGNTEETNYDDAAVAYTVFYHNMMKGKSLKHSVVAMQMASGDKNFLPLDGKALRERVKKEFEYILNKGLPKPSTL